jgi:CspA family cold shock protein
MEGGRAAEMFEVYGPSPLRACVPIFMQDQALREFLRNGLRKSRNTQEERMQGTVKWFNRVKGYGFIKPEQGEDVFVHYTGIEGPKGHKNLEEGQKVEFTITQGEKGSKAVDVRVI